MDKTKYYLRISELISEDVTGEISEEKKDELETWMQEIPENRLLYEKLRSEESILENIKRTEKINKDDAWEKINSGISAKKRNFKLSPYSFLKYAAIIILPLLTGIVIQRALMNNKDEIIAEHKIVNESVPGTKKALLTLSDGTVLSLEKNINQAITEINGNINNENNTLKYAKQDDEQHDISIVFNSLKTPRGGEYNLILADGSEVWLNADTELRYPVNFSDTIRQVYLSGEAYFEVEHNSERPFIVTTNMIDVTVLGTSFNVMAYKDDKQVQTTLISGKVSISDKQSETILSPGFQGSLDIDSQKIISRKVDTDTYTAWKDGKFVFMNEDLNSIMLKLGRWYDIAPVFTNEDLQNYHFTGTLKRYDSISDILEKLELTTNITFEIKEGTVFISKKE